YALTINRSADTLLTILNDILDYSKIEAGKLALEATDLDLREIMEDVAELLAPQANEKRIEIACFAHPGFPESLRGDPVRLRQILLNLAGNAVKFTEHGSVFLEGRLVEDGGGKARVRVSVEDTGIGIPEAAQARLFASFVQADGSTTRKYGGTGLGLAITRQLTEIMGGKIGFSSEPGKGSLFWVELTLEKGSGAQARSPSAVDLAGRRVLIVDDHPTNLLILSTNLKTRGCGVVEARSGKEALEKLREPSGGRFELAILDVNMPEMSGVEVAGEMKREPGLRGIPVIFLSSTDPETLEPGSLTGGPVEWLSKPVRWARLENVIHKLLGSAPSRRDGRGSERGSPPAAPQAPPGHGRRVLLAEDNEVNQKVAVHVLSRQGYEVDVVETGVKAVEAVARKDYDLVLMDMQMPEMDGVEATVEIRRREASSGKRIPILAMTANAMEADRRRCAAAGMDGHIA
ncbi:MAG: response regulator, partial [Thermoanaerobaculia bacterium]